MDPLVHFGLTAGLLSVADLAGCNINKEIFAAVVVGGVFLDADKAFEIISNSLKKKKGQMPDITAQCRILHSALAFPFGIVLSFLAISYLPFLAVLLHIFADSFIPGLIKDGKNYPSHSPRKWVAIPFIKKSWEITTVGWPVTYPPEFNWVYNKLGPAIGGVLLVSSVLYCWFRLFFKYIFLIGGKV